MSNAGAGFVSGEKNGNVISPKGSNNSGGSRVAELSSPEDIQDADLDPEDLVIEELENGRSTIRQRKEGEKPVKIDLDTISSEYKRRLGVWFDTEELSAMSEGRDLIEGRDSEEEDIDEVWNGIKNDIQDRNDLVRQRKKEEEIASAREEMKKYSKYDTDVNDLSGSEFQDLILEAQGEGTTEPEGFEEVKRKIEEKWAKSEPNTEINTPELEEEDLEAGIRAFEERGGVFEELAEDLRQSDHQNQYETIGPNTRKITTTDEEMKQALRDPENEPVENICVEIEEDTGDTVVAVVSQE